MYKASYTPRHRGFDEHMGYFQGCESAYTHVAACCTAGSATGDQDFTCSGKPQTNPYDGPQFLGYDWFKSGSAGGWHPTHPSLHVLLLTIPL